MLYLQVKQDGSFNYPLIEENVRYLLPHNVSFATDLSSVDMTEYGFYQFHSVTPAFHQINEKAVEKSPLLIEGKYVQQWEITATTDDEKQANLAKAAAEFSDLVTLKLNSSANRMGYDSILSAVSYKDSTSVKYAAEGKAFAKWRDDVWSVCEQAFDNFKITGVIPSSADFLTALPELTINYD
jgi:hypothetical protein